MAWGAGRSSCGPAAERLRRALQRHDARRAAERRGVRQPPRGARPDLRLGQALQQEAATPRLGMMTPGGQNLIDLELQPRLPRPVRHDLGHFALSRPVGREPRIHRLRLDKGQRKCAVATQSPPVWPRVSPCRPLNGPGVPSNAATTNRRRKPKPTTRTRRRAEPAGVDGAGTGVDRDALLRTLFPEGIPPSARRRFRRQ